MRRKMERAMARKLEKRRGRGRETEKEEREKK